MNGHLSACGIRRKCYSLELIAEPFGLLRVSKEAHFGYDPCMHLVQRASIFAQQKSAAVRLVPWEP